MATPYHAPVANSPTLKRSFTALTASVPPQPDRSDSSQTTTTSAHQARPQVCYDTPFSYKRRQPSFSTSSDMPAAAGPQAYHTQFPSFMSVYGLNQTSMESQGAALADSTKAGTVNADGSVPFLGTENNISHQHRDSTSTHTSESTDSSPTTTISTADSSALTDPSPSSSPESPITIIPLSSFTPTSFGVRFLEDLRMSEGSPSDPLKPFALERPMTSPSPRKPRNAKGLALNLASITTTTSDRSPEPTIFSPPPVATGFVKPMPPKPRRKPSLLTLQTCASPGLPDAFPRLTIDVPPTPGFSRPHLKHSVSSPALQLFSPDPRGLSMPVGGMTLPPFERSAVSGLSGAFRRPTTLKESTALDTAGIIEEEEMPIVTQMATRSGADIRGDPFDAPPSQEDGVERGYPDGPIAIYEPSVYLYLEPTAEEALQFDVVLNVASEVRNPFKFSNAEDSPTKALHNAQLKRAESAKTPVPDTATSTATFQTAFQWQADSQKTPTGSSPTTPRPPAKVEPEYIHVPWEHNTDIANELMGLCELIDSRVKDGKRVLVHCQQGASRSASLIIAYGIYRDPGLSVNDAYHAAQAKSKWISPNMKLMYALQDFQKEVEQKKLLTTTGFRRVGGRSPTKHRNTISADGADLSPSEPLTAPLPDREGNSPGGTPSRQRGYSTPDFGGVTPGPSSAPSSFVWTPKAGQGQVGLWGSFPPEVQQSRPAVLKIEKTPAESSLPTAILAPRVPGDILGAFPSSYDTPPNSGLSPKRDSSASLRSFPSLPASGRPQMDIRSQSAEYPTQYATRVVDNTPPTPGLWSPRVQEFARTSSFHQTFPLNKAVRAPSPDELMSPRVTEFVNPFRLAPPPPPVPAPAAPINFSRPLSTRPSPVKAAKPAVDPRSPAAKGEVPIIRSIDEML